MRLLFGKISDAPVFVHSNLKPLLINLPKLIITGVCDCSSETDLSMNVMSLPLTYPVLVPCAKSTCLSTAPSGIVGL